METGDPGDVEIRDPRGFGSKDQGDCRRNMWGPRRWGRRAPGDTRSGDKGNPGTQGRPEWGQRGHRDHRPTGHQESDKEDPGTRGHEEWGQKRPRRHQEWGQREHRKQGQRDSGNGNPKGCPGTGVLLGMGTEGT